MNKPATPPPQAKDSTHTVPSASSSPLAKRPKRNPVPADPEPQIDISQGPHPTDTMANEDSNPVTKVDEAPPLLIKKLSQKAKLPTRGSEFAAGYDLYSSQSTIIPAQGKALVDTDLAIAVPAGTYGRVAPRSGLASKNHIDVGAGVIDADYRGQVKVLLFNHAQSAFEVEEGDRIAQLVLERIYTPQVVEVDELEESVRGAGGFGSTG